MANQEPFPQNHNSTGEQIPHSGVSGHEFPVVDYDKTPLHEAAEQHIRIPDNPDEGFRHAPLSPEEVSITKKERRKKKLKRNLAVSAGLLAAGAAASVIIPNVMASNSGATEKNPGTTGDPGHSNTEAVPGTGTATEEAPQENPDDFVPSAPENENGIPVGVKLTEEQIQTLESGTPEERNEVYNATIIPELDATVREIAHSSTVSSDLSWEYEDLDGDGRDVYTALTNENRTKAEIKFMATQMFNRRETNNDFTTRLIPAGSTEAQAETYVSESGAEKSTFSFLYGEEGKDPINNGETINFYSNIHAEVVDGTIYLTYNG